MNMLDFDLTTVINFTFFYAHCLLGSVFVIVVACIYLLTVNRSNYFEILGIPHEKPKFLIGNLRNYPFIGENQHQFYFVEEIYKKHVNKQYVGMYKYRKPMIMVRDPNICHEILTKHFHHFQNRPGPAVDPRKDPLSNHLINLHGQKWKSVRSQLTPIFTPLKLKNMFHDMNECVKDFCKYLEKQISEHNDEFEMIDLFSKLDLNIAGKCILGLDDDSLRNPSSKYNTICKQLFKSTIKSKYKQIFQFIFPNHTRFVETKNINANKIVNFLQDALKKTFAFKETKHNKRNDFMKLLIDLKGNEEIFDTSDTSTNVLDKNFLTDSVIMSNLFIFLTTGYESTSITLASVIYELALNPSVQDKLREEVIKVTNQLKILTYSSLTDLKYLSQVISESQRLHPVNTSLSRQCTSEKFNLPRTQIFVARGTHICIPTFAIYKDPKYFQDPDQFDPDRFSNQKIKLFLPFGEGPRQCIAKGYALMELKLILTHLICKYKFMVCPKTEVPLSYIPDKLLITPENGIWIKLLN